MADSHPTDPDLDPAAVIARLAKSMEAMPGALTALTRQIEELTALQRLAMLGEERIFDFLYEDRRVRLHLPYAHIDKVQRYILQRSTFFEARLLAEVGHLVPPRGVVVDAGANIGNHTVFFSLFAGAAEVIAFEPMRETFAILQRNVFLNGLTGVRCINQALGEVQGSAALGVYRADNMGMTSMALERSGGYPVTTLDSLALPTLDLLKIDVEGSQVSVLRGAAETLRRLKPVVWVELRPQFSEVAEGDATLAALGYRKDQVLSQTDFIYRAA